MSEFLLSKILARIAQAKRILIFGHVKPDGDAFGSALGLMWLLRAQGQVAEVSFEDSVGVAFHFLPGAEEIQDYPADNHDLIIAVDGSDGARYGAHFSEARHAKRGPFIICIDHHKTNTRFADLNWVDSQYAATAQMIYELARYANWSISKEAAICLATGCTTDTNAFSTDHTTPEVLETVAALIRQGASLATIIRNAMSLRTASDVALWGRILTTLQVEKGVAWAASRQADRIAVGARAGDGGGISGFIRNIIDVHIGILFTEADEQTVRLSMRSQANYDVGSLAFELGGGGHTQAAGATLNMTLEEAIKLVVPKAQAIGMGG